MLTEFLMLQRAFLIQSPNHYCQTLMEMVSVMVLTMSPSAALISVLEAQTTSRPTLLQILIPMVMATLIV